MSAAEEEVRFPITAPGAPQAAKAVDEVAKSMTKADTAYKKMAENSARVSQSLGALGGAARQLSPELGALGESVARAGGAMTSMTAVLGSSGVGIAVGGLIAAIGLYAEYTKNAAEETAKLTKSQEDQVKAMELQIDTALKLSNSVLNPGSGTGTSLAEQLAQQQVTLAALNRGDLGVGGTSRTQAESSLRRSIDELQKQLEKSHNVDENDAYQRLMESRGLGPGQNIDDAGPGVGRLPGNSGRYRQNIEAADALQKQLDDRQKFLDSAAEGIKAEQMLQAQKRTTERDMNRLALDHELDDKRIHEQAIRDEDKKTYDERERLFLAERKQSAALRAIGISAYQGVAAVGVQSLQMLAKGHKVGIKDMIGGIGDYMVADGLRWSLQGAASLNPVQVGLGLAEMAAGIAMGAAGGSGGGGGGGGGSAGGGQRFWDGSKSVAGSPISPAVAPSAVSGAPVTIYMQSLLTPTADDGVRVQRAYQEAQRQGRL